MSTEVIEVVAERIDSPQLPPDEPQILPTENDPREEALGNLCSHVQTLLAANDTSELDALHAVGTSIVDASRQDLYGPQVTKEVATRLNTYRQKIQFSARFAEAYDTGGFDELKSMQTESGDDYVWSVTHVRFLLRVKNESERAALAQECARSNWPCRKLEAEVQACLGQAEDAPNANVDISSLLKHLLTLHKDWADFIKTLASPDTNLKDRIAASSRSLTEKQKSMLRTVIQQFPLFTESICDCNGYLSQINVP